MASVTRQTVLRSSSVRSRPRPRKYEPRLRQKPVEDDERAEGEREPVGRRGLERPAAPRDDDERECRHEQHVLPGCDERQRGPADARAPEQRHHQVVEREPDDQDIQRPDRPPKCHWGPIAISVMPLLSTRTL
jgi:hypothetical protein